MTREAYLLHFLRLADGSPVTPPGTPLPHETLEYDIAFESMWDLDDGRMPRRWVGDEESAEDERCGRLIR